MRTRSHNVRAKNLSKNMLIGVAAVLSLLWGAAQGASASSLDFDITLEDVVIRHDVSADIHLKVFVNELQPCDGKVIFAVHGFAHTAATWGPLAEAIFEENPAGQNVCQIVAIDLPGHGGSSLPTTAPPTAPLLFGDLFLEDYVTVLQNTLERLPAETGLQAKTLLAHSQGGLLIQMTQQALKSNGTDLRQEFDIKHVVLMAPVPGQPISWAFADNGTALALLGQFVDFTPALGIHINIPDPVWPILFFSAADVEPCPPPPSFWVVVPNAPTPAEVTARGYNAREPFVSALQLVGARPSVDAGLFGPDTRTTLQIVSYEQDTIILPSESALLYAHLTGDSSGAGFAEVSGAEAVHDFHVSDPSSLLDQIAGRITLP